MGQATNSFWDSRMDMSPWHGCVRHLESHLGSDGFVCTPDDCTVLGTIHKSRSRRSHPMIWQTWHKGRHPQHHKLGSDDSSLDTVLGMLTPLWCAGLLSIRGSSSDSKEWPWGWGSHPRRSKYP